MARRWAQAERLLESDTDPLMAIRQLTFDELEIHVLREELPTYLRSVGRDDEILSCLELLDVLDNPAQTDEEHNARRVRREITVGWPRLIQAVETGLQAISDDSVKQIPRWDEGCWELKSR